jgi:hypothetical protein
MLHKKGCIEHYWETEDELSNGDFTSGLARPPP